MTRIDSHMITNDSFFTSLQEKTTKSNIKCYKVADFFCGGGGFSEGFKLAGFEIIFAVDKWEPAVRTHHANHPNANTRRDDVIRISNLPDEEFHTLVPDTDVIIGSPPCTFFSNSNKSGKADKTLGIQLIKAYLRIVARKAIKENSQLKYWVLENVPNVATYIQDEYTFAELGIEKEGSFKVKYESTGVYNAKYFGVASNRKRYLCGNFPIPTQLILSDNATRTIQDILSRLKNPCHSLDEKIADPNYPNFKMLSQDITDHHYIMEVAQFEWEKAKRHKQDKGYMGKMAFPEDFTKPSRTIMATMSCSSRESIIYPYIAAENRYRLPTVREVACLMSYPLDYRFYGSSKSIKYKLVGNSVPPKMSFAIAKAIAQENHLKIPACYTPILFSEKDNQEFKNLNGATFPLNTEKEKKYNIQFKYHIPYMIINVYRVELANEISDINPLQFIWKTEIHRSQGQKAKIYNPCIKESDFSQKIQQKIHSFINLMQPNLSDFNSFQKIYCLTTEKRKELKAMGPMELLESIAKFINEEIGIQSDEECLDFQVQDESIQIPIKICLGYCILNMIITKMRELTDEG